MVKMQEALRQAAQMLKQAGIDNAMFEAGQLVLCVTGQPHMEQEFILPENLKRLQELAARRAQHEPLQYIIGEWDFLDLTLAVGPGVLIPRAETEELCLHACELLKGIGEPVVLDLCAGSGAIALGLQSCVSSARILAVENDSKAYAFLERNIWSFAEKHGRAPTPMLADALTYAEKLPHGSVDMVVSNPPYVTNEEYESLQQELYHEPRQALVAPENGLLFYRVIAAQYHKVLKSGGHILFEIGQTQGDDVRKILQKNGYTNVCVHKDMAGSERIAQGQRE